MVSGTRGPGESKLEIDRRRLRTRVLHLEEELRRVEKNRNTIRSARERSGICKCAIVGYTNAGKSTLMNALTDAGIFAEDKLFATLDPTTRQYVLPGGTKILLTDTVGFIRNLPHHLIQAFKSTLEEAVWADLLMVVCDASDEDFVRQLSVTEKLLEELGAAGKPILFVFNKCDRIDDDDRIAEMQQIAKDAGGAFVFVSARTGEGLNTLSQKLEQLASQGKKEMYLLLPADAGDKLSELYGAGENVQVEYRENGIFVTLLGDEKLRGRFAKYRVDIEV